MSATKFSETVYKLEGDKDIPLFKPADKERVDKIEEALKGLRAEEAIELLKRVTGCIKKGRTK